MIEVTKENFEEEVLNSALPVVVDLWGPKCAPCLALLPQVGDLSERYVGKIRFCKLNAAENRRLAITLKVMGLPTFLFYKNGVLQDRITGEEVTLEAITSRAEALL